MKKLLAIFALAGFMIAAPVFANEGGVRLDPAPNQSEDLSALQRGAKLFVNYCLNCHGASAMRYNRLRDIGLSEEQIQQNLLFTSDKVGDTMRIAMDREDAKKWFGAVPPDLSVIARARQRLALHLPAHVLPRRHASDRLEQPGVRQGRHAARAVGAARSARAQVRRGQVRARRRA